AADDRRGHEAAESEADGAARPRAEGATSRAVDGGRTARGGACLSKPEGQAARARQPALSLFLAGARGRRDHAEGADLRPAPRLRDGGPGGRRRREDRFRPHGPQLDDRYAERLSAREREAEARDDGADRASAPGRRVSPLAPVGPPRAPKA